MKTVNWWTVKNNMAACHVGENALWPITATACFPINPAEKKNTIVSWFTGVFPRLAPVTRFTTLRTCYTFSRTWQQQLVLTRLAPVTCFPALTVSTGYTFFRAWHQLHGFPRLALVACRNFKFWFEFCVIGTFSDIKKIIQLKLTLGISMDLLPEIPNSTTSITTCKQPWKTNQNCVTVPTKSSRRSRCCNWRSENNIVNSHCVRISPQRPNLHITFMSNLIIKIPFIYY